MLATQQAVEDRVHECRRQQIVADVVGKCLARSLCLVKLLLVDILGYGESQQPKKVLLEVGVNSERTMLYRY